MATLSDISEGTVTVINMDSDGMRVQMAGMGIITGTEIDILTNKGKGPIIVRVKNARIALGRRMAKKINVKGK